ncbi:MAG: NAD(P)H-dependent oxidoreductase [Rhizobiaceae bacterium]|nr:NAD(P)H-dependent oxidoreductase [Rhizobiaceae bacterium]
MAALVVLAHPLAGSLSHRLAGAVASALRGGGHETTVLDLYAEGFEPRLRAEERSGYYATAAAGADIARHAALLREAESLVFVFPTWWFGPPAALKGWIDRVFSPGIAFDHSPGFGPIVPRLTKLRRAAVVTTLGTPWWVDWIAMRRPVRRTFKTAVVGACAPKAHFSYLPLYAAENLSEGRIAAFERRIVAALG